MYRVVFFRTLGGRSPVEEFIRATPANHQRKIAGVLELLAEHGPRLTRPYADQVRGPLRELRISFGRKQYRIFHFFMLGDLAVLVHAFQKKQQRLPKREIETAEARMKEFRDQVEKGDLRP